MKTHPANRLLAFVLALVMVLGLVPVSGTASGLVWNETDLNIQPVAKYTAPCGHQIRLNMSAEISQFDSERYPVPLGHVGRDACCKTSIICNQGNCAVSFAEPGGTGCILQRDLKDDVVTLWDFNGCAVGIFFAVDTQAGDDSV